MYIEPAIVNTLWVSIPLALSTIFISHPKWRWRWMLACMIFLVGIAHYRQVVLPSEFLYLPGYLDVTYPLIALISWVVYGELLRLNGGVRLPKGEMWRSARQWTPVLCGALMGELAAVALLAPQAKDNAARARVALAAVAGGMLSPIGDANLLILGHRIPHLLLYMIPLGLLGVLIADPQPDDLESESSDNQGVSFWLAIIPLILYFVIPQNALLILLEAIFLLALYTGKRLNGFRWDTLCWVVLLSGMLILSMAGGLPEFIALGSENIVLNYARELPGMLAAGGILAGSLIDGSISGVFVHAYIDRALDLTNPKYHFALAAGFSIGGILPFVIGRCLKAALTRYLLLCVVGLVYIWFASNWLFVGPF